VQQWKDDTSTLFKSEDSKNTTEISAGLSTLMPTHSQEHHESQHHDDDLINLIRQGVVGQRHSIKTPFGERKLVYADYTASGRFLRQIEDFFDTHIAPLYANTHTEASATGAQTTTLREEARSIIANSVKAPSDLYATLFVGTGCSGAIEKMIKVLGISLPTYADKKWNLSSRIPEEERPVVFIGPFEHHSNELPWRDSLATVIVIPEDKYGCPDMKVLEEMLMKYSDRTIKIGSFCAGSNVTGICINTKKIAVLLHKYNALAFFDYAGSGAYVSIDVGGEREEESMDAIFMSPHKFIGGPGSTGILIAKRKLFDGVYGIETKTPTFPGGGTVTYVSPYGEDYEEAIEAREDAGTPGIPQSIRTGLAFQVKEMIGSERIEELERDHCEMVFRYLQGDKNISLIGSDRRAYFDSSKRVPIFSFNIVTSFAGRKTPKKILHPVFVVKLLNDIYGIQARAGCSCTGPYAHRLFGMMGEDNELANAGRKLTKRGYPMFKLGWARVNFNYFISDEELKFICDAIRQIGKHGWKLLPFYKLDPSGLFIHKDNLSGHEDASHGIVSLTDLNLTLPLKKHPSSPKEEILNPNNQAQCASNDFHSVLEDADVIYRTAEKHLRKVIISQSDENFKRSPLADSFIESLSPDIDMNTIWWSTSEDVVNHYRQFLPVDIKSCTGYAW